MGRCDRRHAGRSRRVIHIGQLRTYADWQPAERKADTVRAPVSGRLIGTFDSTGTGGPANANAQNPPSDASPMPHSGGCSAKSATARRSSGVTCGVSIPDHELPARGHLPLPGESVVQSLSQPATLLIDNSRIPISAGTAREPHRSSATAARSVHRKAAATVSVRAAAASSDASSSVNAGRSRVLTLPGIGALAMIENRQ